MSPLEKRKKTLELAATAYDLLANGDLDEHMVALNMLDEAAALDPVALKVYQDNIAKSVMLSITASKPSTLITLKNWDNSVLGCEKGAMMVSVLPNTYFVVFGRGDPKQIDVDSDIVVKESDACFS
jgi:hypothetical protein